MNENEQGGGAPEFARRVEAMGARLAQVVLPPAENPAVARGSRQQALRNEVETWTDNQRQALEDYRSAASSGVLAVSRFMTSDRNWSALTIDQKLRAINLWQLEQEAIERYPAA